MNPQVTPDSSTHTYGPFGASGGFNANPVFNTIQVVDHVVGELRVDGDVVTINGHDLVSFHQVQAVDDIIGDHNVVALNDVIAGRNVEADTGAIIALGGGIAGQNVQSLGDLNAVGNANILGTLDAANLARLVVEGMKLQSFVLSFHRTGGGVLEHFAADYPASGTLTTADRIFGLTTATTNTPINLDNANGFLNRGVGLLAADPTVILLDTLLDQTLNFLRTIAVVEFNTAVSGGTPVTLVVEPKLHTDNINGVNRRRIALILGTPSGTAFDLSNAVAFPNNSVLTIRIFGLIQ